MDPSIFHQYREDCPGSITLIFECRDRDGTRVDIRLGCHQRAQSDYTGGGKLKPAIHVTWTGTGKMTGVTSINDDPYSNEYCMNVCPNRTVCYAKRYSLIFKNVRSCFKRNGDLMSKAILPVQMLPCFTPGDTIRIHSYGEYRNATHLTNHRNMAKKNDASRFVGWSHRDDLISKARIPDNMQFIFSAKVNEIDALIPDGFDGVYIPVTEEVAEREGVDILCKGQHCLECNRCYSGKPPGVIYAKFKPINVPARLPV